MYLVLNKTKEREFAPKIYSLLSSLENYPPSHYKTLFTQQNIMLTTDYQPRGIGVIT